MELLAFLENMDGPHRRSAILRVADACNVSRRTVTRWLENSAELKPIYKEAINKEFNRQIFSL